MPTLGIYTQVPFCASKCTFCNFSSSVERTAMFEQYTRGLQIELDGLDRFYFDRRLPLDALSFQVDSLYIGGGTPALLGKDRLASLLKSLRARFQCNEDMEFTLETTPGSVDQSLLQNLRDLGVNRLSIGAQSFDDGELRAVGRLHSAADTVELAQGARAMGFSNVSLDLIAGLPLQTEASFHMGLATAVRLRPEHVSLYLFEIDEKSRLGREVVHGGNRYQAATVPSDELMADAYEYAQTFLFDEGYAQYEISNFALPGKVSRHNQKYWRLDPYIGLGAGAHSFDGTHRWSNHVDARGYVARLEAGRSPIGESRAISPEERIEEFFFLGLRQSEGVDLNWARRRWGTRQLSHWGDKIQSLVDEGWLIAEGARVRLSPKAFLISNEIFQEFVSI
jgi:oxygen-independent coproporphyrinogen III oxidase